MTPTGLPSWCFFCEHKVERFFEFAHWLFWTIICPRKPKPHWTLSIIINITSIIIIITTKWEALRIRGSGVTLTVIATCSSRVGIKNPKLVFFSNFLHQKPRIICLHHGLKINCFFNFLLFEVHFIFFQHLFWKGTSLDKVHFIWTLTCWQLRHFMLPFLPLPLTYLCTHSHFLHPVSFWRTNLNVENIF